MIEWISQPWPWYVGGPLIALVLATLMYFGKRFGVSSNLDTMCSIAGAGKFVDYFNFNWRNNIWNLVFILGSLLGGFIAREYLTDTSTVALSEATLNNLKTLDVEVTGFLPSLFSFEGLLSLKGVIMLLGGGVLVGFGTRYAGGCTSGHAISGLSNLELPSLIAVIGFFIGGLIMTHLILPHLLAI